MYIHWLTSRLILYLITNWCCLFSRRLSSNILISSSIKMVNVKVSGFCCRPWISTQNTTLDQGLETLITIVLNLYIFSLHRLLSETRDKICGYAQDTTMTGMLSEVPRGSTRHPCVLRLWSLMWPALGTVHQRSGAPVVTSSDPWWWMAGVALAHDKEFKGTLFQVDHVEIRGAFLIKWLDR